MFGHDRLRSGSTRHFPFYRRASTVQAYADGAVVSSRRSPTATRTSASSRPSRAPSGRAADPDPDVRDGLAAVRLIESTATAVEIGGEVKL